MENLKHKLIEIVKDNTANYSHCQGSNLMYEIVVGNTKYIVPVDVSDRAEVGDATFNKQEKASFLMRWIRKAIEKNELRWQEVIDKGDSL